MSPDSKSTRRASLLLVVMCVFLPACDDVLDRVSTKRPAPAPVPEGAVDSGRVSLRGNATGSEGDPIRLTAEVANPRGELEYDWILDGRGSLMSRQADPHNAVLIPSTTGRFEVTVTVTEDGEYVGSATLTIRITD